MESKLAVAPDVFTSRCVVFHIDRNILRVVISPCSAIPPANRALTLEDFVRLAGNGDDDGITVAGCFHRSG